MKKGFISLLIVTLLLSLLTTSYASDGYDAIARYTDIDVYAFKKAGYTCEYNDMEMSAVFTPINKQIGLTISGGETYSINFDVIAIYAKTSGYVFLPRITFTRLVESRNLMTSAYIKVGDNRYRVNFGDPFKAKYSSSYYANVAYEIMGIDGVQMIYDMTTSNQTVKVSMGDSSEVNIPSYKLSYLKDFYAICQEAGILDTPYIMEYDDNCDIIALLNKN